MDFKEKVYQHYVSALNEKINGLQQTLNELSDSAKNETKSTAGDKHETALAMLQIEQENTRIKFREATEQKAQLESINIELSSLKIVKESLIKNRIIQKRKIKKMMATRMGCFWKCTSGSFFYNVYDLN